TITVAAPPTVTALSQPPSGPTSGGTRVTLTGTNFSGATAVRFGSVAAQSFQVLSSLEILAISPAQAAGTVDVTVTTSAGTSATSTADQFTYVGTGPFVGASIEPSSGFISPSATATVTVQANLPGGVTLGSWTLDVTYDPAVLQVVDCTGAASTLTTCNPAYTATTIRIPGVATANGGMAGTQALATLTFRGVGGSGTSSALSVAIQDFADGAGRQLSATGIAGQLTVSPPPTVTSVSPTVGPGRGGTALTISGANFQTGAAASVRHTTGSLAASNVVVGSASSLTATAPRSPERYASGTLSGQLRLVGDVNGNGSVTSLDALCILRAVAVLPATTSCPAAMLTTTVDVVVANPDGQSGTLASAFTYRHADVNGNGSITSLDALCTLRQVASLPATSSCPAPPSAAASSPSSAAVRSAAASAAPVSSSASGSVGLQPAGGTLAPGGSATVDLQATIGGGSLGAWTVDVGYDPAVARVGACTSSVGSICNTTYAPNTVRITGAEAQGLAGTSTLASLTFEAVGEAGASTSLGVVVDDLVDPAGNRIAASARDGVLRIRPAGRATPEPTATLAPTSTPAPTLTPTPIPSTATPAPTLAPTAPPAATASPTALPGTSAPNAATTPEWLTALAALFGS
ncbi:MAG: IPT/TIG domain-containing protein, partial [Chloroflexi bacterium]|nr:IPT/TIG domain-containing protein [Chloroflexota bacterium]